MPHRPISRSRPYTPKSGRVAGRAFTSERQYRNALARSQGFASWSEKQRSAKPIRTPAAEHALSRTERKARTSALRALNRMRRFGESLARAAREERTTANAVRKYAASALKKKAHGQYVATKFDRLYREIKMVTPDGLVTVRVTDSRTATLVAKYWNAVAHYGRTGDRSQLRPFFRKQIRAMKRTYSFVTDTRVIDRLIHAGELSIDDLYQIED